jgi:3-deoxy-manno-octulosonate cytidylyltransferase (CMP-KDO synthetase)
LPIAESSGLNMQVYGIIPARYGSTRLPGKVMLDIGGKPMIQHVYERAKRSPAIDRLVVATDDDRVFHCVQGFGGEAIKTSPHHASGTDRVAEAARILMLADSDVVVNIQADQPLFPPGMVDEIVGPFREDPHLPMGALIYPIQTQEELNTPGIVKVVCDKKGFALYFSRSPMPYVIAPSGSARYYKHIGPYAYRMEFLQQFTKLERGELERAESLEQLRALEHGYRIKMVMTRFDSQEVDTPEDLKRVRDQLA